MKNNYKLLLIVLGLAIVLFVGVNIRESSEGFLFDTQIMDAIHGNITVSVQKFMSVITNLGSKYFFGVIGVVLFGYYIYKKDRYKAGMIFTSIVICYLINALLKFTFVRVRPMDYMLITKTSPSFPSGHSMVSMSFYSTITYIFTNKLSNERIRPIFWVMNFALIGLIGFSRLYLGVHWPTDVICGFILGYIVFYISKEKFREPRFFYEKD